MDTLYRFRLKLQSYMFTRLYLHIPFCLRKCPYCAFVSREAAHSDIDAYVKTMLEEMRLAGSRYKAAGQLQSIYMGGGTPSLLNPQQVELLLRQAETTFGLSQNSEITIEANPGTVDERLLSGYRQAGVNRISLGVQSFDEEMLKHLGRIHSADQARDAFAAARSAGFNNIGIDLIHSLPGQTLSMWQNDLQLAIGLGPEHLSVYGLTVEEGTPFAERYEDASLLPDEDTSADMYEDADSTLTTAGYEHYEIANYARPGFRSQHNSGYWRRDGYLGLGAGAHSFIRNSQYGIRFGNSSEIDDYCHSIHNNELPHQDLAELSRNDAMAEFMFLGLRLADGVTVEGFQSEFGVTLAEIFGEELNIMQQQGLLISADNRIKLTQRGMMLSNQFFSAFLREMEQTD